MPTITDAGAVAETVKQRLGAGVHQIEAGIEQGRRAIARGRGAAEDGVAVASLHIRRHPIRTVAVVAAAGALLGCVIGYAFSRWPRR
jgi:ElaB/YqjD/DUF883 family membrane-anchored ribosome-binding protein